MTPIPPHQSRHQIPDTIVRVSGATVYQGISGKNKNARAKRTSEPSRIIAHRIIDDTDPARSSAVDVINPKGENGSKGKKRKKSKERYVRRCLKRSVVETNHL